MSLISFVKANSLVQVLGTVPTISVEKTDGCQMYLSQEALDAQLITAQSSEMNILIPAGWIAHKNFQLFHVKIYIFD